MTSTPELTYYLNEIGRLPVLTKEAQLRHCRRIHAWVHWPAGRAQAPERVARAGRRSLDTMTRTNLRLVVSIARKYTGRGLELPDLIQEGSLGLIRGLELYDPTRGYAVSTYAYWWVRQAITRAIHTHARLIRLPINTHETLARIRRFSATFQHAHGRAPTLPEIAEALEYSPERIRQVLTASEVTDCVSLDAPASESGDSIVSLVSNPDDNPSNTPELALARLTDTEMLMEALGLLPEDEARILQALCFEGRTLHEVSTELEINRAKVQQLRNRALNRLRLFFASRGVAVA
jgi:RNA polymerase primary sigma factor